MIKAAPGSERLKSFAERINRLLDEKQGIGADIGDIYTEAKSVGYVPKVLRKAIARQRMDAGKRQEEDSILELYEAALDGRTREAVKLAAQGASSREIELATGIDHVTVSRTVSLKKKHETVVSSTAKLDPSTPVTLTALPSSAPVAASEGDLGVAAAGGPLDALEEANGACEIAGGTDGGGGTVGGARPPGGRAHEEAGREGDGGVERGVLAGAAGLTGEGICGVGDRTAPTERPSQEVVGVDTRPEGTSIDLTIPPFLRRERISA